MSTNGMVNSNLFTMAKPNETVDESIYKTEKPL